MRFGWLLVAAILVVGLAGSAFALHSREGNAQFISAQQSLTPVAAAQLQSLILTTSDPRPGYGGVSARAHEVRCVSAHRSGLGNPWSCVVRYPRPPVVHYRVSVHADRSIYGVGEPFGKHKVLLSVRGCCVASTP